MTGRPGTKHGVSQGTRLAPQPGTVDLGRGRQFRWIELTCGCVVKWADPWPAVMELVTCRDCGQPARATARWTLPPDEAVQARERAFEAFAKNLADGTWF